MLQDGTPPFPDPPACVVRYAEWREEPDPDPGVPRIILSELRAVPALAWIDAAVLWVVPILVFYVPILLLLWLFCLVHLARLLARSGKARDAKLYAQLAPQGDGGSDQAPVEIWLFDGRTRIGTDIGFATVVDGSLYYSGLKSEFSFSTLTTRRVPIKRSGVGLAFTREGRKYMLRMRTIEGRFGGNPFGGIRELWTPENVGQTVIEVLPPTTPSRDCVRDEAVRWVHGLAVPIAFLYSPLAYVLCFPFEIGPNPLVAGATCFVMLELPATLYLAMRVRRLRALMCASPPEIPART